ncbi:MAG: hypothetical protein Q9227_002025 [Pyrenula ochraceoflavens]
MGLQKGTSQSPDSASPFPNYRQMTSLRELINNSTTSQSPAEFVRLRSLTPTSPSSSPSLEKPNAAGKEREHTPVRSNSASAPVLVDSSSRSVPKTEISRRRKANLRPRQSNLSFTPPPGNSQLNPHLISSAPGSSESARSDSIEGSLSFASSSPSDSESISSPASFTSRAPLGLDISNPFPISSSPYEPKLPPLQIRRDTVGSWSPDSPTQRIMVREREPPRAPLSPAELNQQGRVPALKDDAQSHPAQRPVLWTTASHDSPGGMEGRGSINNQTQSQPRVNHLEALAQSTNGIPRNSSNNSKAPQFGQPTQLGSTYYPPSRPPTSTDKNQPQYSTANATSVGPPHSQPKDSVLFHKSKPAHSYAGSARLPSNPTYPSRPAQPPMYPVQPYSYNSHAAPSSSTVGNFVNAVSNSTSYNNVFDDTGTKFEPYTYMDATRANENIKELLEGAFEDDEDKPRTRLRKKKKKSGDDATTSLTKKMEGMNVTSENQEGNDDELEEDDGTVQGLKVKLLPHQIDGVEWMKEKENGAKKVRGRHPKGGILADDMGLGKTIQSIALILTNPKPPESEIEKLHENKDKNKRPISKGLDKGTLVVAPLGLIKQWEGEIHDRVETSHALRLCVHHGASRAKHSKDLRKYDVVITTYNILTSEHAACNDQIKTGVFGLNWYRIILDEAHSIKNRNAKASQAACALHAEYRWCLTGTPMQNNLDELQSLIKFLRIQPYDDLANWREGITKPMNNGRGGLAIERLRVLLRTFMKRRTKDILKKEGALKGGSTKDVDGKSAEFKIVKRTVEKIEADFGPAERNYYQRLEQRTDESLERIMMGGEKNKFTSALTLLLRLRQVCNHPQLVKSDLIKEKDGFETMKAGNQTPRKKAVQDAEIDSLTDMLGGMGMDTKYCDVCQIKLSAKAAASGSIRCPECDEDLEGVGLPPKKKEKKRIEQSRKKDGPSGNSTAIPSQRHRRIVSDSDSEEGEGEWLVSEDERGKTKLGRTGGSDDENAEGGGIWLGNDDSEEDVKTAGRRKKAVDVDSDEEDEDSDEDQESSDAESSNEESTLAEEDVVSEDSEDIYADGTGADNLILSTKIRHLLDILRRDSAQHKYIVFSFFTSMLDLIEPFLRREHLNYTRYDGQMRPDDREASLNHLRNSSKTRILLCSLKAGSLGLNLTAACRVVILEPFWNPFVEEQAIDRVHRLNQTKDVVVYKMTIKDTVEERILELQEKKRELAEQTIEGKKLAGANLSMKDMLALFRHDAESAHKIGKFGIDGGGRSNGSLVGGTVDARRREGERMNVGKRMEDPVLIEDEMLLLSSTTFVEITYMPWVDAKKETIPELVQVQPQLVHFCYNPSLLYYANEPTLLDLVPLRRLREAPRSLILNLWDILKVSNQKAESLCQASQPDSTYKPLCTIFSLLGLK